ncbi:hypothetical protein QQ045_031768 [Rhodiola kirilowii]
MIAAFDFDHRRAAYDGVQATVMCVHKESPTIPHFSHMTIADDFTVTNHLIRKVVTSSPKAVALATLSHLLSPNPTTPHAFGTFDDLSSPSVYVKQTAYEALTSALWVMVDGAEGEEAVGSDDVNKHMSMVSLLRSTTDLSLESALSEMELDLDESFVASVLETELIPGGNLLGFFNWVRKNPKFTLTSRVLEALVKSISVQMRKKDAYAVWDMVKEIGEKDKGVLNVFSGIF